MLLVDTSSGTNATAWREGEGNGWLQSIFSVWRQRQPFRRAAIHLASHHRPQTEDSAIMHMTRRDLWNDVRVNGGYMRAHTLAHKGWSARPPTARIFIVVDVALNCWLGCNWKATLGDRRDGCTGSEITLSVWHICHYNRCVCVHV